ncbi:ABC transporter permease [Ruania zhangjianzhongii]|uniref:ABC transporter permease n=2 Tax=Ruania zhangjianzhongii TaxID=2603206 RepID=UPI001AEFAA8D|nr:ABC transporter permease [Ruania zhangjianzhongii]
MTALTATKPRTRRVRLSWNMRTMAQAVIALYVLVAVFGPLLIPYDANVTSTIDRLQPPGASLDDGTTSWLGTDQVGRSIIAQVISGSRVSMLIAAATVGIAGVLGLVLGLISGYFGRWGDSLIMRLGDIQLAFPSILLAILIAGVLGPSVTNVIFTLAITRWVIFARVVRASALVASKSEAVEGAKTLGVTNFWIIVRYILPRVLGPLAVAATVQVGLMVIAEASLSFLGLGVPLDQASWGSIIANGRDYLSSAWWIAAFPGLALVILVVATGMATDGKRAANQTM